MIALLLAVALSPLPVGVERSRDTLPPASIRVSTSLDTNGGGVDRPTAIDAERAFAADAKNLGQWTAFRKWASADATMFVPQPVNAQTFLKDREDPPKAIDWWPTESYISCDGSLAVNTGGWMRPDGTAGYFSTVWQRQENGDWKWIVDGGDTLKTARDRPATPKVVRASCKRLPTSYEKPQYAEPHKTVDGEGTSRDRSLLWEWHVMADGHRTFMASVWISKTQSYEPMILDDIPAAPE